MTTTLYAELEQGTDEWLQARCGLLTASTIGRLITPTLKTANNDTPRGLINTLAAERITGHVDYIHPSFDMQRGTEDEPFARAAYAEHYAKHFAPVEEVGFITRDFGDYTLGYSPDGLVGDTGLIEIKSRRPKAHIATILAGEPPAENMAQLQTGLLITGRKWIDYVSYCQGMPLWTVRVEPSEQWAEAIKGTAAAFESAVDNVIRDYQTKTAGLPVMERHEYGWEASDVITF